MKKIDLSPYTAIFILLLLASCSSKPGLDNESNTSKRNPVWDRVKPQKLEPTTLRPFNFNLQGTLGEEAIDMFLYYDPNDIPQKSNCLEVKGDLNYRNRQIPIRKLNGTLCFDTGIATLHTSKNRINPSAFRGIFKGQVFDFKGKWTTNTKSEENSFRLDNISHSIDEKSLKLFAQKIDEHFQQLAYLKLSHVGYDELGIYLKNLRWDQVEIKKFSPTNLKWNCWNDSLNSNYFYQESIDLWHYDNSQQFVIIIHATEWKVIDNQEIETEKTTVWQWKDAHFVNILIDKAPSRTMPNADLIARIEGNQLQVIQKQKHQIWEWTL